MTKMNFVWLCHDLQLFMTGLLTLLTAAILKFLVNIVGQRTWHRFLQGPSLCKIFSVNVWLYPALCPQKMLYCTHFYIAHCCLFPNIWKSLNILIMGAQRLTNMWRRPILFLSLINRRPLNEPRKPKLSPKPPVRHKVPWPAKRGGRFAAPFVIDDGRKSTFC